MNKDLVNSSINEFCSYQPPDENFVIRTNLEIETIQTEFLVDIPPYEGRGVWRHNAKTQLPWLEFPGGVVAGDRLEIIQ